MSQDKENDIENNDIAKSARSERIDEIERNIAHYIFHITERLFLIFILTMTICGVAVEIYHMYIVKIIGLPDILLMFLYIEVVGMVSVYYSDRRSVFVYPIFIAITALTRLIILQGKETAPESVLFEAFAILLLSLSAIVIVRMSRD
ncbi:phosphate-starvation-inducible PsiE family protein [Roseospira marina]|uniref:Protein PsiE n=1 Tax=Roseospira marina TaxID=140057 RepID=A0A5M6I6X2_9PROT|nr:phosphate-starvation-inducible PsiE family protein [Roseospira marina]KAA5604004.1 phosphate-starvation-inducible PsiE family protein [Roseospira marina]MBB4315894.1 protein PsiE [Roseospira marina]MBB5089060.1 protein PsiE [Roseospira marina]